MRCAGVLSRQNDISTSSDGQHHGGHVPAPTGGASRRGRGGSPPLITSTQRLSKSQKSPTHISRSRSQHFNAPVPEYATSFTTSPTTPHSPSQSFNAQYSSLPLGKKSSQYSGGNTTQRNSSYIPLPAATTPSHQSGGYTPQRNPSQIGAQTHGRGSRYSTAPLPCVVSVSRFLYLI